MALRRKGDVFRRLREMKIGDRQEFPIEKWNAARSDASALKRDYGVVYRVNKQDENTIAVTRTV